MPKQKKISLPRIGLRTVKTMISATILTLVYGLIGRNPCFACIGAVFGMGNGFDEGKRSGGNRFFGTVVGGFVAIAFVPLYQLRPFGLPRWLFLTAGLFVVLYASQLLGVHGSIPPGSVVFYVVLLTVPSDHYMLYTLNRILDTGLGVALSLAISHFFPSPQEKQARLKEEIAREQAQLQAHEILLEHLNNP